MPKQGQPITVNATNLASLGKDDVIRILYVDDDLNAMEISKQILMELADFEIDNASCVDEAFKKLETCNYDVVISDYQMPQKDGLQFLKELREKKNDIPFILFTGKGREEVAIKAINLGAQGYFNKQGDPETVYGELANGINLAVKAGNSKSALQEKYEALERVAESIGAGLAVISKDYQVSWANSTLRNLGVSPNKKCYQTFDKSETVCPDCGVKKIFEQNLPFDVHEYKSVNSKGEVTWIELRVTPLKDKDGNITAALELAVPITERKKTEELIRKNQDQLNAILSNAPIGIATSDSNKLFLSANSAFCTILGYSEEELRKLTFKDVTYAEDIVASVINMERLCSGEISFFSQEKRYKRKDGTIIDGKITVTSIQENEHSPLLFVAELEDITERKRMENSLIKSNERYVNLFESARDVIATLDLKGNITSVNKAAMEYGFKIEDIIGKNMLQFISKKYWPQIAQNLVLVSQGNTSRGDIELDTPVGKVFVEFQASPLIQEGKIDGIMVVLRNNTERRVAEDHLRSLKRFDERIIDSLGDALLIIDPEDYTILNANKSVLDQLKLERKDLIGKTCYGATHSGLVPCGSEHPCPIRQVMESGKPITVEHTHLDSDHNELFVEVSAYPVKNIEGKTVVIHVSKDITQRKLMERDLRASEEKFRAITDCALDAIVMIDDKQRVVYWNPAAQRIFGYKKDEVLGKFSSFLVPKHLGEGTEKGLNGINKNSSISFAGILETVGRKKNGSEFPLEISGSQIQMGGAIFSVAIIRDVTERKRMQNKLREYSSHLKYMVELRTAQLKDANERLVKSERLATIGELAGMVGHDLRNPLAGIKNATYFLKKKGTVISEANYKDMLGVIEKAIDHSDKIVNELLDYAREIHLELQDCSLRELLADVLGRLKIPEKVKIVNNIPEKFIVRVDVDKLGRVFMNLVKNAVEAMPNGGALTVESKIVGGNSEISFADTGIGISEEILPKLFLPLITSKAQGMGFGLAICKRIIEAHRGIIRVETVKGKGTTFVITLPRD